MYTEYFQWYSHALGRNMEMKQYGHGGRPVLFIPCQDGRFFDFENFKMTDVFAPWIESGQVTVYAVDTMDQETWSNQSGDPAWRSQRHEQWMTYLANEVAPFIQHRTNEANHWEGTPGIIAFGCSLGATHAVNLYFRYPDTFVGLLALSGIYAASYGFGDYQDGLVYANSPVDYLAGLPSDHPYIHKYNQNKGIICVGQGPWEIPETTRTVQRLCQEKGINLWVDFWGQDVEHDWNWWYRQVPYFLPHLL